MARAAVADLLVGRGRVLALRVAHRGVCHARLPLVGELEAPEAAPGEGGYLEPGRGGVGGELAGVGRGGGGRGLLGDWSREGEREAEKERGEAGRGGAGEGVGEFEGKQVEAKKKIPSRVPFRALVLPFFLL